MPEPRIADVPAILSDWAVTNDFMIHTQLSWRTKFKGAVRHHTTALATDKDGNVVSHTLTVTTNA